MSHRGRCSQRCCRAAFVTPAVWGVWSPPDVERGPSRLQQADPRAGPHTDYTSPSRHLNLTFGFPADAPSMRTGSPRPTPPHARPRGSPTGPTPRLATAQLATWPFLPPCEDRTRPVPSATAIGQPSSTARCGKTGRPVSISARPRPQSSRGPAERRGHCLCP